MIQEEFKVFTTLHTKISESFTEIGVFPQLPFLNWNSIPHLPLPKITEPNWNLKTEVNFSGTYNDKVKEKKRGVPHAVSNQLN